MKRSMVSRGEGWLMFVRWWSRVGGDEWMNGWVEVANGRTLHRERTV